MLGSRFHVVYVEQPDEPRDDLSALKSWIDLRLAKSEELRQRCAELLNDLNKLHRRQQRWARRSIFRQRTQ